MGTMEGAGVGLMVAALGATVVVVAAASVTAA